MFEKFACLLARWHVKNEKLARRLASRHAKLKNWHNFGTLAEKNEKLRGVWHVGTLVRRTPWHAWHIWQAV